ncbi:hypothetical protein SteCoe_16899 [Stentor coeruleus]|uniref:Translin-associated factor X-interacting protein 1 N-terminal domain-containing protein n=1 Tax=Stentor coeruleus TaxID=5963 RepID=A0A1R2C074_9CILI|nr:hypothetical protein SteCoe_16899 [Stentor coeruleus]
MSGMIRFESLPGKKRNGLLANKNLQKEENSSEISQLYKFSSSKVDYASASPFANKHTTSLTKLEKNPQLRLKISMNKACTLKNTVNTLKTIYEKKSRGSICSLYEPSKKQKQEIRLEKIIEILGKCSDDNDKINMCKDAIECICEVDPNYAKGLILIKNTYESIILKNSEKFIQDKNVLFSESAYFNLKTLYKNTADIKLKLQQLLSQHKKITDKMLRVNISENENEEDSKQRINKIIYQNIVFDKDLQGIQLDIEKMHGIVKKFKSFEKSKISQKNITNHLNESFCYKSENLVNESIDYELGNDKKLRYHMRRSFEMPFLSLNTVEGS